MKSFQSWLKQNRLDAIGYSCLFMLLLIVVLVVTLLVHRHSIQINFFPSKIYLSEHDANKFGEYHDALEMAGDLSRLDMVSLLLGVFAILLGLIAIMGFWLIRRDVIDRAHITAQETVMYLANSNQLVNNDGKPVFVPPTQAGLSQAIAQAQSQPIEDEEGDI